MGNTEAATRKKRRSQEQLVAREEAPERWKYLDDGEIARVYRAAGGTSYNIEDKKSQLSCRINLRLWLANELHSARSAPPNENFQRLTRVEDAVRELQHALKAYPLIGRVLAWEVDRLEGSPYSGPASFEMVRAELPDKHGARVFLLTQAGVIVPSPKAKEWVREFIQNVAKVRELMEHAWASERKRQASLGTDQKQAKRADYIRYALVDNLADAFSDISGKSPAATRKGPWCSFLAAVLSCSEGKELDNGNGAYRIWRDTKMWLSQCEKVQSTSDILRSTMKRMEEGEPSAK